MLNSSYSKISYINNNLQDPVFIIGDKTPTKFENFGGGVGDLTAKVTSLNIICTFKLQLPAQTLNKKEIVDSTIKELFNMGNTWKIEMGRGKDKVFFKNLRLFECDIDYSPNIRGIEINITLHGSLYSILNNVKLASLGIKEADLKSNIETQNPEFTLTELLTVVLQKTKKYIEKKIRLGNIPTNDIGTYTVPENMNISVDGLGVSDSNITTTGNIIIPKTKQYIKEEDPLSLIDIDSMTLFNDLKIIIISENDNHKKAYEEIWEIPIKRTKAINKCFNAKQDDRTSVHKYLTEILRLQLYQLINVPQISTEKNNIELLLIPIGALAGGNLNEFVYKGGHYVGQQGISNKKSSNFNLLSTQNSVLSVRASALRGSDSIQSIMTSEAMANVRDEVKTETSLYNILEATSKSITVEILGAPRITYYDTVPIEFISEVFTGKYKVIEFEHKIDGNKFITSFEAVRIEKELARSSLKAKEIADDNSKQQEDDISWWDNIINKNKHEMAENEALKLKYGGIHQ